MKVHFGQIYVEPGVSFPFNHRFQLRLGEAISALVEPSSAFIREYGTDFELMFRISAKRGIPATEVRGPAVFRRAKDVEYTLFLPFDVIARRPPVPEAALRYVLKAACSVFESLGIDPSGVAGAEEALVQEVCSDPTMFE